MNVRGEGSSQLSATGFGRPEVNQAVVRRHFLIFCNRSDHLARKIRQRERIREEAEAAATPHARQRQSVGQGTRRLVVPEDA